MAKDDIPPITNKMESAPNKRLGDVSLPLNREIRRKYRKLKKKKHFRDELLRRGQTVEAAEKALEKQRMDEETKAELLKNLDVQKFLDVLNDLLTGKKKLVIESIRQPAGNSRPNPCDYTHTFKVEDVGARS